MKHDSAEHMGDTKKVLWVLPFVTTIAVATGRNKQGLLKIGFWGNVFCFAGS